MEVVIIEDEQYTAEDLVNKVKSSAPDVTIVSVLKSIKEAIDYLSHNPQPDLFFSDIQLGDGLSFEIFGHFKTSAPVIFITAFDEYALKAFKANGIDYILKPFNSKAISDSITRFKSFAGKRNGNQIDELLSYLKAHPARQSSILVYQNDKIIPIRIPDIALVYTENELVKVLCDDGKQLFANTTLEELSKSLGDRFFRANRQFLVNRKVVKDVSQYFGRKLTVNLSINFSERITVSKEKASLFLDWLKNT